MRAQARVTRPLFLRGRESLACVLRLSARRRALARLGLESEPNSRKGMDPTGGARLAMGEGERGERGHWVGLKKRKQASGLGCGEEKERERKSGLGYLARERERIKG